MRMVSEGKYLLSIITVGLALRILTVIALDIQPESDYAAYRSMAVNLLDGKGLMDYLGNQAMYNVGYPLFILAPVFFLTGKSLLAAQVVNAVLGGVSIALCYLISREAGAGSKGRLLAAALFALYIPSWIYAEYLAKENLMAPLMLGVVWCSLCLSKKSSLGTAMLCGALSGVLTLTGSAALSLGFAVLFALMVGPARINRKLMMLAVIFITATAVTTPWLIRNYQVLGAPVLNTNGGFNLYLGNNPAATGFFVSIADTPVGPRWNAMRETGEIQASQTLRQEAFSWMVAHPSEFFALAAKKAAFFWMPPVHKGEGQTSAKEAVIRQFWLAQFVVLVSGALGSMMLPGLRTRQVALIWVSVAAYTALHTLFYVVFRYREPIMPLLCILAALTVEHLARWLAFRKHAGSALCRNSTA